MEPYLPYRRYFIREVRLLIWRYPFVVMVTFVAGAGIGFFNDVHITDTIKWFLTPIPLGHTQVHLQIVVWLAIGCISDVLIRSVVLYFQDRDPDYAKTQVAIKQRRANKAKVQQEQALWPKVVDASEQQSCQDFEDNLCLINRFSAVKENLVDRWGVGVAPAMLFGEFGKAIGNGWEALTTSERSYVADLVEKAVTQGSVPLKSMIEQGLLSGLAGELASHPERLEAVASILGQASLASVQSQVRLLPRQRT